jgi:cell division protein ZapA
MAESRLSADGKALEVTILGREFRIACPPGQEQELIDAVTYVDGKMRDIRDGAKVMGAERVAIMAALNIAHEHLTTRVAGPVDVSELRRRITQLNASLDEALSEQDKLF